MKKQKYISIGALAGTLLLFLYFFVMSIASQSITATISQFNEMWYWIVILSTGFGIQAGLYFYLRDLVKRNNHSATGIAAASTGTSSVSMIACCAHHLTEILPLVGLSGAAIFLTNYQIPLIILGIIMNIGGIMYMLQVIQKFHEK